MSRYFLSLPGLVCSRYVSQWANRSESEGISLTGHSLIDNDAEWTRVPDDPTSIEAGYPANSQRTFGVDAEYEDVGNVMRRDTSNRGCDAVGALGVTYSAVVGDEESRRQTITVGLQWNRLDFDMCVRLLSRGRSAMSRWGLQSRSSATYP